MCVCVCADRTPRFVYSSEYFCLADSSSIWSVSTNLKFQSKSMRLAISNLTAGYFVLVIYRPVWQQQESKFGRY
ncbi:hypothetical protein BpHYR1_036313 [Brachionus plicatilis]|uniref:Uncharacterized protein n=1 Tax=Brachionus plicatilis TaxID=10195 RepID=A0A3M7SLH6_BRAPC|nr:hypothetical protein BpHYR1_036313 [Brachionus plicatilis]